MHTAIDRLIASSLKTGVALLPLMAAAIAVPAYGQTPTVSTSPGQQPRSSETAPKDAAVADSQQAADEDTKVVGAPADEGDENDEKAVVVTGTSIRGAPPTGTNLIQMDKEGIKATGANSAAELIANIPQASGGFFNEIPQMDAGGGDNSSAGSGVVLKPNLRGTPSSATDSGSSTLILLDGQRTAGTGTINNVPDVNAMPVALLERVEVNTDGGSSIYGSDGIGGVINFVTRRRFEGVQVRGRYGIADDYYNYEVGGILGHSFGRANAYISYSRTGNDNILNRERDYYRSIDWTTGLEVGTQCDLPNILAGGQWYGVDASGNITSGPQATAVNLCTPGRDADLAGRNTRNNVLASFAYDFTDDIKLTLRGRYSDSKSKQIQAPFNTSRTVMSSNPFYQSVPTESACPAPNAALQCQTVNFSLAPGIGRDSVTINGKFKQYGISPELTVNIDDNWQVRTFVNWEKSRTYRHNSTFDTAALTAALNSTDPNSALNPYNVEASNPAVLADIIDEYIDSEAFNEILNARMTVDGALFDLPGGKVRIAAGAEYLKDKFGVKNGGTLVTPIDEAEFRDASRDVKSVFGEINIPIVSSLNSGPLFEELRFAFSGRYDDFSDFGDNFSPRIGATYAPFKWLRFRGNWGKSFRAPTVIDTLNSSNISAQFFPGVGLFGILINPQLPQRNPNDPVILYFGATDPNLKPQTGTNWSVAGEIRPIDGLRAELSYYKIDYRDAIAFLNFVGIYPTFLSFVTHYPSDAQIADFLAPALNAGEILDEVANLPPGSSVYALIDGRTTNMGNAKIEGLDYSARYDFNTPLGSAYVSANGTVQLVNMFQRTRSAAFLDRIAGTPNHRASVNVGLRNGGFRTQFTLNHTDGFTVTRTANRPQDRVSAFNVVNAFFAYEFSDGELGLGSLADGLEVTLNIQNLFDKDPPISRSRGGSGTTNGSTLGRLIQIGVRKDF